MTGLFDQEETSEHDIDPDKDYYAELVGEGKKYKDNAAAARALAEKDAFIERLKTETSGLRQELKTRLNLEEVVDKISKSSPQTPSSERQPVAPEPETEKPAITPDQVKEIVANTLSDAEKRAQRIRNTQFVEQKLQEAFGPGFKRTIKEHAQKLGIGEDFASNLAAEQPHAFLKLFDVAPRQEAPSTAVTAPRTQVNVEGFRPRNDGVKRKSYYDNMRKTEPGRYWSVAVQNEEHKEALRQGESFFDT